jgi:hypothetical protein
VITVAWARLNWICVALLASAASGCSAEATTPHTSHKPAATQPRPGQVAFADNFSNPSSGWQNFLTAGRSSYSGGGYVLAGNPDESEYSPAPFWSDLVHGIRIAVDATESHGDPGVTYYGVACGDRRDRDPEYEFLLSADGEYLIDSAGSWPKNVLASGIASVRPNGLANHIEATCIRGSFPDGTHGMQLGLFINGNPVASAVDARYGDAPVWTGGLMTSSWTKSSIGVIFHRFSIVDETPALLAEPTLPRVVYRNTLQDPFTGWVNTGSYDEVQGRYIDGQWQLQAAGGSSSWVAAPYSAQDLTSITVSVSTHLVSGGGYASAGAGCFDAATGKGLFAFSLDTRGNWSIESDEGSKYLRDVATGRTSIRSDAISGTCTSTPDNKSHLSLRIGLTDVASATSSAAPPAHWNGGVCVLTYQGDPSATFTFRDFLMSRLA